MSFTFMYLVGCRSEIRPHISDDPVVSSLSDIEPAMGKNSVNNKSVKGIFSGRWKYDRSFQTIELELSMDGDFKFSSRSCMWSIYSTGKWIREFGFLILHSDDSLMKNQVVPGSLSAFAGLWNQPVYFNHYVLSQKQDMLISTYEKVVDKLLYFTR